ncbi:MAG TPA: CPBP family intramembrane glutamic endopeptidase [Parvularculaceae bacterium]|nr:CPBP family intramembrane glutamic endopeptidase [Parvularculaceae bacterium]
MTEQTPPPAGSRWRSLAICVLMFAAYYAIVSRIAAYGGPLIKDIAPPAGAPELWWRVDVNLALVGFGDLCAGVVPVFIFCKIARRNFVDLGFNRPGAAIAWLLAFAIQALLIWLDMRMGALGHAPGATGVYALAASAIVGLSAAFAEETLFRGFVMDELRRGGWGVAWQIGVSMFLFGAAHMSWASGPYGWTIPVFTGIVGGFWSLIYVLGKRSLWPPIVAHVINDGMLIPSVFYLMAARAMHG